jgi:hypothetical protein
MSARVALCMLVEAAGELPGSELLLLVHGVLRKPLAAACC